MHQREWLSALRRHPASVLLWAVGWALLVAQTCPSPTSFLYDEENRLRAIVEPPTEANPSGDAAIYDYDAAGNLLAIRRHSAAQLDLLGWHPRCAPTSAGLVTLTLSGTGFNPTASQNVVTVGGASATVQSATLTQLVVTTTGRGQIVVEVPPGGASVSSGASGLRSDCPGVPIITGAIPVKIAPGAGIVIVGSGFRTATHANVVRFNGHTGTVNTAATTNLNASAPADVTSGRISVATGSGSATSTFDVFIWPQPAQVETWKRLAFGVPQAVNITSPGNVALLLFDGTIGQRVFLAKGSGTIGQVQESIRDPDGRLVTPEESTGWLADAVPLGAVGTFTIQVVDGPGAQNGTTPYTLYDVPQNPQEPVTPTGFGEPPNEKTLTTTTPGQDASVRVGLPGTTFQSATGTKTNGPCATFHLYSTFLPPNATAAERGTPIVSSGLTCGDSWNLVFGSGLSGLHTVWADWSGATTGTATFRVTAF